MTTVNSLTTTPSTPPVSAPTDKASPDAGDAIASEVKQILSTIFVGGTSLASPPQAGDSATQASAYQATTTTAPASPPPPECKPPANDTECLATMQSYRELLPKKLKESDLQAIVGDASKPKELQLAAQYMLDNKMVDRFGHQDGDISDKDWKNIGNDQALTDYNRTKSKDYAKNYVPSDLPEGDRLPRPITASDANRELYLYSDSLPDHIGTKELQDIADGKCDKKCPPQLRAAAQFMLDHPDEWQKVAPHDPGKPERSVGRGELQDNTSKNINLRDEELGALQAVQDHKDVFLRDGKLTRDSLGKLANDDSVDPEVRDAAKQLLANPLVFGMLDNARHGHKTRHHNVNDGRATAADIDALKDRLTTTNKTAPGKPVGQHKPKTEKERETYREMLEGADNDPEIKKVVKKKRNALAKALDVVGKVLDVVKMAIDAVSGMLPPPFDAVGLAVGAAVGTVNNFAVKTTAAMLDGESAKDAFKEAAKNEAIDLAGTAVSLVPGAGIAKAGAAAAKIGTSAAKEGAEVAATAGAKEGARAASETAAHEGGKAAAKSGAKQGGETASASAAREGAEDAGEQGAAKGSSWTEKAKEAGVELKDTAVDEASGEAQSRAEEEAERRWNQRHHKPHQQQPEASASLG